MIRRPLLPAALAFPLAAIAFVGCAPEAAPAPTDTPTAAAPSASATPVGPEIAPFPTGATASTTALPADCDGLLTDEMRAELEGIPLNAPGMGGGIREDSTRVCVWADPAATVTKLVVVIGYAPDREASDALYLLQVDEGFECYEPDGGVRCEKQWTNTDHAIEVTEGRTLFFRDGVIIDTQYTALAPQGFTASIVSKLWP